MFNFKNYLIILITLFIFVGCQNKQTLNEPFQVNASDRIAPLEINSTVLQGIINLQKPEHISSEIVIGITGDIMFHTTQLKRAYDESLDTYHFDRSFEVISPYLSESDVMIGNLETTLTGPRGGIHVADGTFFREYSGYPCFNTPTIAALHVKEAGFDLLTTANNHTLDSRKSGVDLTIDQLDALNIPHTGSFKTKEASEQLMILDQKGIQFGLIAYTYALNGFTLSEEDNYKVNHLNNYDPAAIQKMIDNIRIASKQCDVLMVSIHFGNEYQEYPSNIQKDVFNQMIEAGADIVLGSHPHVLQPIEIVQTNTHRGFIIYSLGNFISSQIYSDNANKDLGVILQMTFNKVDTKINLTAIDMVPTYVSQSNNQITVLPVLDAEMVESKGFVLSSYDQQRIEYAKKYVLQLMQTWIDQPLTLSNNKIHLEYNHTLSDTP